MSKIDRFLTHLNARGGVALRLEPGEPPIMELPGGHRQNLMAQEMLGSVLDGLAKEIVPEALSTTFLRGDRVNFEHVFEDVVYQVICGRTKYGTHMVVARLSIPASAMAPKPQAAGEGTSPGPTGLGKLEPFIRRLLGASGSDLYFVCDETPAIRRDGVVEPLEDAPTLNPKQMEDFLKSWIPASSWEAFQNGMDTEFSMTPPGLVYRLRVRIFHDLVGPSVSIRVAPRLVPDAESLGLSEPIRRLANLNKGLVLLAGPSGSGKTTTLASLLDLANHSRKAFIISIQDSLEFDFPKGSCLIRHKEVACDPQRQARAMRAALHQDPDILALGELRDRESVDLALQGAQTGRLVIAQVPAATLLDAFYWIIDTFPLDQRSWVRNRLADHLRALLVHTLLPRTGGGRAAAIETLFNNPPIADHLRSGRLDQIPAAMKAGRYGQVSHSEALVRLVADKKVEATEAYQRCNDRDAFIAACKKAGIPFDPRAEGRITEQ